MRILGLSGFQREAAAVLIEDGRIVAAAAEERFSHVRRDANFPRRAVRYVLREGNLTARELDAVVWFEKPLRRFERNLVTTLTAFPGSARVFAHGMFRWLGDRLWMRNLICSELLIDPDKLRFAVHHEAHAASACLTAPWAGQPTDFLVLDGAGEWTCSAGGSWQDGRIETLFELPFPHSLGLFVRATAEFLGFDPVADDALVSELAAFGNPATLRAEIGQILEVGGERGYRFDPARLRYRFDTDRWFAESVTELFGPRRTPGAPLRMQSGDARDADLAAAVMDAVERAALELARRLQQHSGAARLCLGGDLAQLPRVVARLLAEGPYAEIHVDPAPSDSGAALGAALLAHAALGGSVADAWHGPALGEPVLDDPGKTHRLLDRPEAVRHALLAALCTGRIAGWVRGRFEWGPRALGRRCLLADPREPGIAARIRREIKHREEFRPWGCAIPAERAAEFVELPPGAASPARCKMIALRARTALRERAPAVVAADGTCVPHLVERDADPEFHALLSEFGARAGIPVLLTSSLDLRGDPPARGETEARAVLARSGLDLLVVENRLYDGEA
jgi:carbamoyltransferase